MPTTYEVDPRTGKIKKVSGRGGLESAPVARATPAKPQAAKPAARPWWWYATPAGINNEVLYRLKQQAEFNKGQKLIAGSAANPVMAGDPVYYDTRKKPTDIAAYSPALRSTLQATAAVLGKAPADERLMMVNLAQRFFSGDPFRARDPESTPLGQVIKGYERGVISALGAKQVEQMTPDQKGWFYDMPAALATTAALAPLTPSLPVAFGGAGLGGQALRWPLNLAIDSAVGGMFIDQTQGTSSDMLAEAGVPGFGALRIQPGKDDRVSAAFKGIPGDIAIGAVVGGALSGTLAAGAKLVEAAPAVARNLRERRIKSEVETARAQTVSSQVQEVADPETGEYRFTQPDQQPPKTWKQAAAEMLGTKPEAAPIPSIENPTTETFGKAQPADLPTAQDPQEDAWYDPSVPEIDVPAVALNRLDDQALMELDQAEGPVLPQIEQRMAVQQAPEPDPMVSTATTAAPTQNLAEPITPYADQWQGLSNDELLRVAHPASSPDLFAKVQGLTGREFEQFTRQDVLDGLGQLQQEGKTVIPNRLLSNTELMRPEDIAVRPEVYQFKYNADAKTGVQKGGSLTNVFQWNPDAEGVPQVWDNPMTGTTDMVNGHHRLQKAIELGIPSLRVEKLLAATPQQARAQGAISNISSGGGTVFDAAKFLRERGVKNPAELQQLGIPLDSGFGAQGLALSRLPDNIFQDAVDGRVSTGKAVALGGSDLDEGQMQTAMKALGGREISDAAFNEVLQQVRNAPVIKAGEKAQKSLFDDDEAISLAVTKGNLAAKIRADLIGDKNLFGRVGKNADKLQGAGNKISVQGSTQVAMDAQTLLGNFDATKYAEGTPISQLLNEGAQQIAEGAKPGVVATRIKRQLAEAASAAPAVEAPAQAMPAATAAEDAAATELVNKAFANLSPADRDAVKARILQKAIANREVRPSATPITPTPEGPKAGLDDAAGLAADEQRLAGEYAARDALVAQELARAERQSTGYNNKSFEEKKAAGLGQGWRENSSDASLLRPGLELYHGTTDAGRKGIMANGFRVSNAEQSGTVLGEGVYFTGNPGYANAYGQKTVWGQLPDGAKILDLYAQGKTVADLANEAGITGPLNPHPGGFDDVRLSYDQQQQIKDWAAANGYDGIRFKSFDTPDKPQLETVVYNVDLANKMVGAKPESAPKLDPNANPEREARRLGSYNNGKGKWGITEQQWLSAFKRLGGVPEWFDLVGGKANWEKLMQGQEMPELEAKIADLIKPQQAASLKLSMVTGELSPAGRQQRLANTRKALEREQVALKEQLEEHVVDIGTRVAISDVNRIRQSKKMAREVLEAVGLAAKVSGIDPERIRLVSEINLLDIAGPEDVAASVGEWVPSYGEFIRQNPQDPLSRVAQGRIAGLRIGADGPPGFEDLLFLALHPQLDKRLATFVRKPISHDAFHEAFHRLQEYMLPEETQALASPQALEQMREIIKNGNGTYEKGMSASELQAEAFAVYAQGRLDRLKGKAGLVPQAFEKMRSLLTNIKQRVKVILKRQPDYVDLYEQAYAGFLGERAQVADGLSIPQMDYLTKNLDKLVANANPGVVNQVFDYLTLRKQQWQDLANGLDNEINRGGC